jgi:hypothetical protein
MAPESSFTRRVPAGVPAYGQPPVRDHQLESWTPVAPDECYLWFNEVLANTPPENAKALAILGLPDDNNKYWLCCMIRPSCRV